MTIYAREQCANICKDQHMLCSLTKSSPIVVIWIRPSFIPIGSDGAV